MSLESYQTSGYFSPETDQQNKKKIQHIQHTSMK